MCPKTEREREKNKKKKRPSPKSSLASARFPPLFLPSSLSQSSYHLLPLPLPLRLCVKFENVVGGQVQTQIPRQGLSTRRCCLKSQEIGNTFP